MSKRIFVCLKSFLFVGVAAATAVSAQPAGEAPRKPSEGPREEVPFYVLFQLFLNHAQAAASQGPKALETFYRSSGHDPEMALSLDLHSAPDLLREEMGARPSNPTAIELRERECRRAEVLGSVYRDLRREWQTERGNADATSEAFMNRIWSGEVFAWKVYDLEPDTAKRNSSECQRRFELEALR